MATREILALDTATPQILAPQTGDTYIANRAVEIAPQAGTKALTLTGGTQTTSQPVIDATQTWNAGGVTFTGIKFNATDTASAAASLLMDLQVGGVSKAQINKVGRATFSDWVLATRFVETTVTTQGLIFSGGLNYLDSASGLVIRETSAYTGAQFAVEGNDIFAQRRATSAQTFRIYNTFTDASNYERGKIQWDTNVLKIGTEKAGTGTARALELQTDGTTRLTIGTNGNATFSASVYIGNANYLGWLNRSLLNSPSDGVIGLYNNNANDFNRLQFGGTTSSFPALKRSATALETKLADDSAYAPHAMQYLDITDGIDAPGSATGRARIYVDTTDGDLKIIFSDGTIKTIVVDT